MAETFVAEAPGWGALVVVGLVPSSVETGPSWTRVHHYAGSSRLFLRPSGDERVLCRPTGVSWDVIVCGCPQMGNPVRKLRTRRSERP